ncbi:hypothetical protein GQ44DRAFT_699433 [Phaeosphaeriaceae sp. PMI808]|nr:hypothetical protein GQ44DRAFT_699433 [Phaeosphaeriaceae sp. PMI808]
MTYGKVLWTYRPWKQCQFKPTTVSRQYIHTQRHPKNIALRTSDRIPIWLQGRKVQHYGLTARLHGRFQCRHLSNDALQNGPLKVSNPASLAYHDLTDAFARVKFIETRLKYSFKNPMVCIEALKISGAAWPLYTSGTIHHVSRNNRLALLGDRVLNLAICETWFLTEHSTKKYSDMSNIVVSRATLAMAGRALQLHTNILMPDGSSPGKSSIAETLEALLGAIYVDSNYKLTTVKGVIKRLKLYEYQVLKSEASMVEENNESIPREELHSTGNEVRQEYSLRKLGDSAQQPNVQLHEQVERVEDTPTEGVIESESPFELPPQPKSLTDSQALSQTPVTKLKLSNRERLKQEAKQATIINIRKAELEIRRTQQEIGILQRVERSDTQNKANVLENAMTGYIILRRFGTNSSILTNISTILQQLYGEMGRAIQIRAGMVIETDGGIEEGNEDEAEEQGAVKMCRGAISELEVRNETETGLEAEELGGKRDRRGETRGRKRKVKGKPKSGT